MTAQELEEWLATDESKQSGTGVGHDSGERIVEILKRYGEDGPREVDEYEEDDLKHMRKVRSPGEGGGGEVFLLLLFCAKC